MVEMIDTHAHLYAEQLLPIEVTIQRAIDSGVGRILLPNIDLKSIEPLKKIVDQYPNLCYPMMGLHPCSVQEDYKKVLAIIEKEFSKNKCCAVGEIGIDLYWDQTTKEIQIDAFEIQCRYAVKYQLPIAIHSREATGLILDILETQFTNQLTGVFHCFTGDLLEARRALALGFYLGIGGVVTFKNSNLRETLKNVPLTHILLETDAPYLAPMPFRGKINEPSYLKYIVKELASIYQCTENQIIETTTNNALKLFNF